MEEKVIDIEEVAQDSHNFNKGNDTEIPEIPEGKRGYS